MKLHSALLILVTALFGTLILNMGYVSMATRSWYEGCHEAALKLKLQNEEQMSNDMEAFCQARNQSIKTYLKVEDK
jgi:hypothetical protein